jgi:phosphohistidine phosphatase SixA
MQHVNRFLVVAVAALLLLAATRESRPGAESREPTVLFLLRHAEKATAPPKDPPLTDTGTARARALADLLGDAGVTHLFASEFARTQQTLAPLAEKCGKPVTVAGAADVAGLAKQLKALPAGSTVVVAGHSNTIPALVRALGGTLDGTTTTANGEQLPDDEFGRLIEVIVPPAGSEAAVSVKSLRLHFGTR